MQYADPMLILLSLSSIACIFMVFSILRSHHLRDYPVLLLLGFSVLNLTWLVFQILLRMQELHLTESFDIFALERIRVYGLLALATVFFHLTRAFGRNNGYALEWWAIGGAFLLTGMVLYENLFALPENLFVIGQYTVVRYLLAFAILVIGWAIFAIAAIWLTLRTYRHMNSPLHRNRNQYWSLAVILLVLGQSTVLSRNLLLGNVMLLAAQGMAVYAVLNYNLPDLRQAARRLTSYVIMTLLTAAIYTAGIYVTQTFFQSIPGYSPLAVGAALALVLATLFNPLLSIVQRFVNGLMAGSRYDARRTLSEYSMSISNILDMEVLATVAVGLISEAMEISYGALITVHREEPPLQQDDAEDRLLPEGMESGDEENHLTANDLTLRAMLFDKKEEQEHCYILRSVSGMGQVLPEGRLALNSPVSETLSREHRPLTQYDIDLLPRFRSLDVKEREWLAGLNMDAYVPIYAKEKWVGLLVLGPKLSGDRYFEEDMILLQTLADQTAVALENARLYEDLKLRNAENERLNDELKKLNAELARLDRAKTDFINIASHELRTPLTQIIGYNDIMSEMLKVNSLQPAMGVQMTDNLRKAARRLEDIVDTMFEVSKLDTRSLDLEQAPVSLASIVTVAIDKWNRGLEERKQTINVRGLANLPAISGDGKRLTQVFSHLIQNAIKYTPDGGWVRISGRMADANGSGPAVEIIVADSGIGIAPEDQERIFEKFYRVGSVMLHSTGTTKFKGAGPGLGLTIARGIVEAHGGKIWVESQGHDEENCLGSKFHVVLPINGKDEKLAVSEN